MRIRLFQSAAASLLSLAVVLHSGSAPAYCLTTTCDTLSEGCMADENGCSESGIPLQWSSLCLYYGIQKDGSERASISASTVEPLMEQAFAAWMNADCGQGTPPFVVQYIGQVECDIPEFNCDLENDENSNTVMFRDTAWPYEDSALAITTVTVDVRNGEILDADMEVNTDGFAFSTGDTDVNNDLLSVLTHEAGHFLGLSHSAIEGATMYAGYTHLDTSLRSLHADDIAGICEIYPDDRELTCALDVPNETHCFGGSECPLSVSGDDGKPHGSNCAATKAPIHFNRLPLLTALALVVALTARRRLQSLRTAPSK